MKRKMLKYLKGGEFIHSSLAQFPIFQELTNEAIPLATPFGSSSKQDHIDKKIGIGQRKV